MTHDFAVHRIPWNSCIVSWSCSAGCRLYLLAYVHVMLFEPLRSTVNQQVCWLRARAPWDTESRLEQNVVPFRNFAFEAKC